ncbi:STAS domain-containing protein [Actinoplanes sp. NPDC049548]|uniref:STAS domain-containing protein n=1 Tax=Actinoplanes sp. NPDC049548 TaxID=3155152 RepID=UPI003434607E
MQIEVVGEGAVTVVVRGELDVAHACELRQVITDLLNRGDVGTIDLDLRGVCSIDSGGLGTVVVANRIAAAVDVRLQVVGSSPFVAELLRMLAADGVIPADVVHNDKYR